MPFFGTFFEEWAFNFAAARWLKKHAADFDLIHLQGRSGFTFPGKQEKTPVVATFHGLISIENQRSGRHEKPSLGLWLHEKWATFFEKKALRQADACIAVSQEMLRSMLEICPKVAEKTHILPNGVDVPTGTPVPKSQNLPTKNLLFVGRLDPIKGIFPLVEAMKNVPLEVQLVMVGDGPARAELENAISVAGLRHRVFLTGALPSEQVFEKIRQSFALVLPSFYETQGIVLLEANACGKPVIASDIAGIREVVRQDETGWMVPVGDPAALASCITRLFEKPDEVARLGEAGRRHVREKFSWEKIALETERFYGQVLAEKMTRSAQKRVKSEQNQCDLRDFPGTLIFSKFA